MKSEILDILNGVSFVQESVCVDVCSSICASYDKALTIMESDQDAFNDDMLIQESKQTSNYNDDGPLTKFIKAVIELIKSIGRKIASMFKTHEKSGRKKAHRKNMRNEKELEKFYLDIGTQKACMLVTVKNVKELAKACKKMTKQLNDITKKCETNFNKDDGVTELDKYLRQTYIPELNKEPIFRINNYLDYEGCGMKIQNTEWVATNKITEKKVEKILNSREINELCQKQTGALEAIQTIVKNQDITQGTKNSLRKLIKCYNDLILTEKALLDAYYENLEHCEKLINILKKYGIDKTSLTESELKERAWDIVTASVYGFTTGAGQVAASHNTQNNNTQYNYTYTY